MNKYYFKKNTLLRIEHFGVLLFTLDGRRFSISKEFAFVLKLLQGKTIEELIGVWWNENPQDLIDLIESLKNKWIIIESEYSINSVVKIIENDYVSDDCLSFPRTVYRELTQVCNLHCIHCYSEGENVGYKWLWFDEIKWVIDELINKGVEFLNIWWGEPLLYKDIFKVLDYAISKWLMIEMTTNGTLLNKNTIERLLSTWLKFIQISLDWSTKEIYETIRVGSNYNTVINSIKALVENWITVSVNTVLMQPNKKDIFNIVNLCESLWVSYYKVSPLMETWRWTDPSLQLDKNELKQIYMDLLAYKKQNNNKMKIIIYQNVLEPVVKNISRMPENHYWCPAGRSTCSIDFNGNVYPCSYMNHKQLVCGNIKNQTLSKIWRDSSVLKELRNISELEWKCKTCSFLSLCRWWCRAMAYLRNNKITATDPLCVIGDKNV